MKYPIKAIVFFSLSLILINKATYSTSPCEQFEEQLIFTVKNTSSIQQSLADMPEESYSTYFKKENITKEEQKSFFQIVSDFSNRVSRFHTSITQEQWKNMGLKNHNEQRVSISQRLILSYCEMLPIVKKLHAFCLDEGIKDSPCFTDAEALLSNFQTFSQFLLKKEERAVPFISVTQVQKKQSANTPSLLFYETKTNFSGFHLQEKKRAKYLLSSLEALNIDALQLPLHYKITFQELIIATQKHLNLFLKRRIKLTELSGRNDITLDARVFFRYSSPIDFESDIMDEAETFLYNPLSLVFQNGCTLTYEEKEANLPNLASFYNYDYHRPIEVRTTETQKENTVHKRRRKQKKQVNAVLSKSNTSKPTTKKSTKMGQEVPNITSSTTTEQTDAEQNVTTTTTFLESDSTQAHNIFADTALPASSVDDTVLVEQQNVATIPASESAQDINENEMNVALIGHQPPVIQIASEDAESSLQRINQLITCLTELVQTGHTLDNAYIIQKAYALKKTFMIHPEPLLEQTQEAASALATFAASLKSKTVPSNSKAPRLRAVPPQTAADFDRFMTPPLRFLKDKIRFGYVRILLEKLGAKIDDTRNGSRVHIDLYGHKTSIHIHDKINGLLDSGRIFSIRQLMLDAGFQITD